MWKLYWAFFPPSGFGFPEVKFLGQSFLILIAKWLSGNVVPMGTPPSAGWEGTPWLAWSVVWKIFHNLLEGGAGVLSLFLFAFLWLLSGLSLLKHVYLSFRFFLPVHILCPFVFQCLSGFWNINLRVVFVAKTVNFLPITFSDVFVQWWKYSGCLLPEKLKMFMEFRPEFLHASHIILCLESSFLSIKWKCFSSKFSLNFNYYR